MENAEAIAMAELDITLIELIEAGLIEEMEINGEPHYGLTASGGALHVRVRDDGRGGADFSHGSGLVGLKDRAEALAGHLQLHSPPGGGTTLEMELPLEPGGPELPPELRL